MYGRPQGSSKITKLLAATAARVHQPQPARSTTWVTTTMISRAGMNQRWNRGWNSSTSIMPLGLAGNLPFQLSSSILFAVLEQRAHVRRAVFLLQKEVALRIAAPPGGREYGLLSVLTQAFANVGVVLEVGAHLFHPPPKVDSALLRIDLLEKPRAEVGDSARFTKIVKAAFALRRKTLWNSLRSARLVPEEALRAALAKAQIDPVRRAEPLSPQEFAALARELP